MGTWQLTSSSEDLMTARSGFISIVESNREGSSHDIRTNTPARLECTGDLHLNLAGILSITFFKVLHHFHVFLCGRNLRSRYNLERQDKPLSESKSRYLICVCISI